MAQKIVPISNPSSFCSVIRVDKDISFVVDNDPGYGVTVPTDKNIGMSRKTYSKKHPITYSPCVSFAEDSITVMDNSSDTSKKVRRSSKNPSKCFSDSGSKVIPKKRTLSAETSNCENPLKKFKRKDTPSNKLITPKLYGLLNCKSKTLNSNKNSPDSDIEILEIKVYSPQSKCMLKQGPDSINRSKILNGMPPENTFKHTNKIDSQTNHMKANSTKLPSHTVPETKFFKDLHHTVNTPISTKSETANEENAQLSVKENSTGAKAVVSKNPGRNISPIFKVKRKSRGATELKKLYENLNEISWAHEKSFQQLLCTDNRHSERITTKISGLKKNMRRMKASASRKLVNTVEKRPTSVKNSAKIALKKAKMDKLKRMPVKPLPKFSKVPLNKIDKKMPSNKENGRVSKLVSKSDKKLTNASFKNKTTQNTKVDGKMKNTMKHKPTIHPPNKVEDIADKCPANNMWCPGSSGLQSALNKNVLKTEKDINGCPKATFEKIVKKYEKVDVSNEFEMFNNLFNKDDSMFSALKKGSNLRVTLEPLEHTNLWNADFYETFKKHILEQAYLQTLEKREQDSISSMFQELHDSLINPNNNNNNNRFNKKKKPEEETLRSSVRQSEGAFRYKEIVVKKQSNYMQFVLVPNPCKRNSLSIEAMKELKDAFLLAKRDPNCKAVLINSSGTYFCSGIDMSVLIGVNRKQVAEEMASTIRDLVLTLSTFTKPVIAAVNGIAVGFGVTLLTYCDIVLASDKATFSVPAARLGYLPEGAITLTLPQVVGAGVATEMLLHCRKLTAEQAQRHGLVSEVLWPTRLMNEVMPRLQSIVSQPLQVMEWTKSMVRCHLWDKLKLHAEREWRLLPPLWLDAQCQHNMKRAVQTGWLLDS